MHVARVWIAGAGATLTGPRLNQESVAHSYLGIVAGYPSRFVCASRPLKMGSLTEFGKFSGNRDDTVSTARGAVFTKC